MAEKIINTRIALRTGDYTYWTTGEGSKLSLYKGEVCICTIDPVGDPGKKNGAAQTAPTVLFKVCDTTGKKFADLDWCSALAADVHTWAKKSLEEFTAWVAKTPKTVTLAVNGQNADYTIEEAIKLVRNEITAGGQAAAITIADESVDGKIKYTAKQGGVDIVESIEINEGDGIEITVKDNVPVISHQDAPTTGEAADVVAGGAGRTYVTEVLVDELGHIAGVKTATEVDPVYDFTTIVPENETPLTIVDKDKTDDEDTVYAVTNLVEGGVNGHEITPTYTAVPTQKYVDEKIAAAVAGAVDYLNVVNNADELAAAAAEATHGDFVRVGTAFGDYHVGDMLIYNKPEEGSAATWDVIHGEEGDIVEVEAGNGLNGGGASGKVTLSAKAGNHIAVDVNGIHHGAKPTTGSAQAAETGTGRTYVTEVLVDDYGHIAGVKTATEVDQTIPTATGNATIASINNETKIVTLKTGAVLGEENGNHKLANDGGTDIELAKVAATGSAYDLAEANTGTDKDGNEVMYFILDCNW